MYKGPTPRKFLFADVPIVVGSFNSHESDFGILKQVEDDSIVNLRVESRQDGGSNKGSSSGNSRGNGNGNGSVGNGNNGNNGNNGGKNSIEDTRI